MGMAQFGKVVLLPQGEFAAFLRATPEDRREVLERFDITAFADVEAWLAEERRSAGAALDRARDDLVHLLARLEDVLADAGVEDPPQREDPREVQAIGEATPESVPPGSGTWPRRSARGDVHDGRLRRRRRPRALSRRSPRRARTVDEHRRRGSRALARTVLDGAAADHEARVHALAAAERAAAVGGHLAAHARMSGRGGGRGRACGAEPHPRGCDGDVEPFGRPPRRGGGRPGDGAGPRVRRDGGRHAARLADAKAREDRRSDLAARVREVSERTDAARPSSRWPSSSTSG